MSKITELESALSADKELETRFQQAIETIGNEGAINKADLFAKAAAAIGFDVTAEDFENAEAAALEVDEEDLELVAGGCVNGHDDWCGKNYHCNLVYKHDTCEGNDHQCYSNYKCFVAEQNGMNGSGY